MKTISPVTLWVNGLQKTATQFNLRSVSDDLATSATFWYSLDEVITTPAPEGQPEAAPMTHTNSLATGNVSMSGADYTAWTGSNDDAYEFCAEVLNLEIV